MSKQAYHCFKLKSHFLEYHPYVPVGLYLCIHTLAHVRILHTLHTSDLEMGENKVYEAWRAGNAKQLAFLSLFYKTVTTVATLQETLDSLTSRLEQRWSLD